MRRFLASIAVGVFALAALPASAADKWDMATAYPDGNFHTQNIRWFADEVKKATGNRLEIVVHSGASLFKLPEIKRAVQTGQVNIAEFLFSAYGNEDPIFEADGIPFLATGYDAAWKLYQAQKPLLEKKLGSQNIRLLYSVAWPGAGVYSKTPMTRLSDYKGVKFRAYSAATARLAELVGAVPVTIQQVEVPQAFATGMAHAMITSPATGADTRAWEYVKYYYETSAIHARNGVVVNERAFRRLPEDVRRAVLEVAGRAETRGWEMSKKVTDDAHKLLAANGMVVAPPPPELMQEFQAVGRQMIQEWAKKVGPDGEVLVKAMAGTGG
jgi:TRAP-type C4-dicarboxylate transport system substrate-binding protein